MRKKIPISILFFWVISIATIYSGCTKNVTTEINSAEKVVLTLGSWRADDFDAWTQLLAEYEQLSGVHIEFKPINPPDYNATLRVQLESGSGQDLMFARSYATGMELYEKGFFADISDLPHLQEHFSESSKDAWRGADGKSFAVPVAAVVQSIYYREPLKTSVF